MTDHAVSGKPFWMMVNACWLIVIQLSVCAASIAFAAETAMVDRVGWLFVHGFFATYSVTSGVHSWLAFRRRDSAGQTQVCVTRNAYSMFVTATAAGSFVSVAVAFRSIVAPGDNGSEPGTLSVLIMTPHMILLFLLFCKSFSQPCDRCCKNKLP